MNEEIKKIIENKENQIRRDAIILHEVVGILKGYQIANKIETENIAYSMTKIMGEIFGDDYIEVLVSCIENKEIENIEITEEILVKSYFLSTLCIMDIEKENDFKRFLKKFNVIRTMIEEYKEYLQEYLDKIKEINKK